MVEKIGTTLTFPKEVLFQVVLHLAVFTFYSFDRNQPQLQPHQVAFFLNYAVAAFFINYYLLPHFFYRKRYLAFAGLVLLLIAGVILVEEFVLEKIYFPDWRGRYFPGIFYTLTDVLPVIVILSGFKFAWDALVKQRELEALQAAVRESELQFLKSQINPHFLFNNLHNLYAYALEQSPKTPEIIMELSGVLRYMLYECREKYVPLTKEVAQLENFVKLNELQIEDRGRVAFSARRIRTGYQIAPLILIVFVENAFKHTTASQTDNIFIDVQLELSDAGRLTFSCRNSFQAQSNTEKLSKGIGLENVRKRLQLLYPDAHRLCIEKREAQYAVHLTIDLHQTAPS